MNVARVKTLVLRHQRHVRAVAGFLYGAASRRALRKRARAMKCCEAIAAVVVGGTSLMGGRGTMCGTFFGASAHRDALQRDEPARHRVVYAEDRA